MTNLKKHAKYMDFRKRKEKCIWEPVCTGKWLPFPHLWPFLLRERREKSLKFSFSLKCDYLEEKSIINFLLCYKFHFTIFGSSSGSVYMQEDTEPSILI